MMKKLFILACVCLLITSCNSNSKNTNDSAISTETTDMHLSLIHISEPRDRQKSRMPSSA